MITYLSKEHLFNLRPSWTELISVIEKALIAIHQGDFVQPVKPYLRYRNPINRIIAMPAFVGGSFNIAGIKWIASFPENIKHHLTRAHAITILNHHETGKPLAILSAHELSGIRTAAVSGYAIQKFANQLPAKKLKVGITGFGPIGQLHAEMVQEVLKDKLESISIYDIQYPNNTINHAKPYEFVDSWQEAYKHADIFITCTTSKERYIDHLPKKGSLQLNVSLRDYFSDVVMQSGCIIVDDWNEICREDTDIERASLKLGLQEKDIFLLSQFASIENSATIDVENILNQGFISFHFMGMAVFDIALGGFFYQKAIKENQGIALPE